MNGDKRRMDEMLNKAINQKAMNQKSLSPETLLSCENVVCSSCGSHIFIKSVVIKRVPSIISPNGQAMNALLEQIMCGKCGRPLPTDQLSQETESE